MRPGGPWPALGRLRGPEQPLLYRHDVHAGQYQMPCLYCHNNAANSWTANIPTVSTCMGCHIIIAAADTAGNADPDIAKLRDYAARGEPIPWVRINKIAEHARFPHMRHVNAAIACQTCHGNIQQMPRVFPEQNVNQMGRCTSSHMRRGVTRDGT
ncbi:MAG: cytochrome c3 family protein, partial [Gemmatimonadetes bacterium]|nr:cytochrome c3 family protein [Gemmatimonadota bacterium]